jgi:Fis family transcriptional regulator
MGEVEAPLLRTVLAYAGDNQCRAAELLGINRGTLRKKMKRHGLL